MRCSCCGSTNVQINVEQKSGYSVKKGILGWLLFGGAGAVAGVNGKQETKKTYHCLDCGKIGADFEVLMTSYTEDRINRALSSNDVRELNSLKQQYRNLEWNLSKYYVSDNQDEECKNESFKFDIFNGILFDYKGNKEELIIPNNANSIKKSVFKDCISIKKIIIPDNITSIEESAFEGCTSLVEVSLSNNITSISASTFSGCTSLKKIIIPNKVTSIGDSAFKGCTSLTSIFIPNSVAKIESNAFEDCTSLTGINIPNSVSSISCSAFNGCISLTSIEVEKNNPKYNSIDGNLYDINTKIFDTETGRFSDKVYIKLIKYAIGKKQTSFIVPDTVTFIGSDAFNGCTSLTGITIPNSVTKIGDSAFKNCTSLTEITIPDSVTSIGDYIFGGSTFEGCSNLTQVNIPNGVTSILSNTFSGCTSLTEITIPNSVTQIGNSAFKNCTSLTNIFIPNSVTKIGYDAFAGCFALKIYCEAEDLPDGWSHIKTSWNSDFRPVVWGYKPEN